MVTLDLEASINHICLKSCLYTAWIYQRINCAHDTPKDWKMLIDSIRNAEERLVQRGQGIDRRCRIVMDLAGPKIRTRSTGLEIRPLKISVHKDIYGKTVRMVEGFLDGKHNLRKKLA